LELLKTKKALFSNAPLFSKKLELINDKDDYLLVQSNIILFFTLINFIIKNFYRSVLSRDDFY